MFVLFPHRDTVINLARYDFFEPTDRKLPSGEIVYGIALLWEAEGEAAAKKSNRK